MIQANYHTHLLYCNHAVGHAVDYIEEALRQGFKELGITDHAPVLECSMSQQDYAKNWCYQPMKLDTMYQFYLPELKEAKEQYQSKIKILSGFETEYLPRMLFFIQLLRKKVDYLNLGVHFFEYENQILNSYSEVNYKTIYGYMDTCINGIKTGLFNTLVHPDLFMFSYQSKNGKREFDEACEEVSRKIIEASIKYNVHLEVNANGLKNSVLFSDGKEWLYPYKRFWEIVKEYKDAKILIGADAHDPKHLAGKSVSEVLKFTDDLNLNIATRMEIHH